jgi:hypothetical protein
MDVGGGLDLAGDTRGRGESGQRSHGQETDTLPRPKKDRDGLYTSVIA